MTTEEKIAANLIKVAHLGGHLRDIPNDYIREAAPALAALFSAEKEKKDAEIADLKFTAFKRLQDIDLLEKRVEELEAMRSAFESINSIKNIHLDNRKAK